MASRHLRTLYGRHDVIEVFEESGFLSLNYAVYVNSKYYTGRSSLKDAMEIAEGLSNK
jgi:hypothetical protein